MSQELGHIDRPEADRFKGKRKLLLVPLVYGPPAEAQEGQAIVKRYWEQVQDQVTSLELKLGLAKHIYQETLTEGGEEGLQRLEAVDAQVRDFVRGKSEAGVILEATEDEGLLLEVIDLQRCLMLPLSSNAVGTRLQEWYNESVRKRYEHISKRIDDTLQSEELGVLLISERHQVQFPVDIEVFYVAPPALEEFRHWFQEWISQQQKQAEEAEDAGEAGGPEEVSQ